MKLVNLASRQLRDGKYSGIRCSSAENCTAYTCLLIRTEVSEGPWDVIDKVFLMLCISP